MGNGLARLSGWKAIEARSVLTKPMGAVAVAEHPKGPGSRPRRLEPRPYGLTRDTDGQA